MLKRLALALFNLVGGVALGIVLLEAALRANPALLLRGMDLPVPVDPPLTARAYDVHYSDADEIYWRPDLIRPIPPADNALEARVVFQTDELGFRNRGPLPPVVDVAVIGRSMSFGASMPTPWPEYLAQATGWRVLNLSEPGVGSQVKQEFLRSFAFPRRPRWVILEVIPSIDILAPNRKTYSYSVELAPHLVRALARRITANGAGQSDETALYPLKVDLPGRSLNFTNRLQYSEFFTVDAAAIASSEQWRSYRQALLDMVAEARAHSACVAVLYAPNKPDIYLPLVMDEAQLEPTLSEYTVLQLENGFLTPQSDARPTVAMIQKNAFAGRDVMAKFAAENGLAFIDPSAAMVNAIVEGRDPFMVYDSHWNDLGHQLVAQAAAQALQSAVCP